MERDLVYFIRHVCGLDINTEEDRVCISHSHCLWSEYERVEGSSALISFTMPME
jgi:hypothetical protein